MDRTTAQTFIDALEAHRGIVAAVGAGGKKSTLHRLIEAHRAIGTRRIALTSTVKIAEAPASLNVPSMINDPGEVIAAVRETRRTNIATLIAAPSTTPNRLAGMPPGLIQDIHREGGFDVTLVKADGARMRWIKAPNDNEPLLPDGTATVLPIVSVRVIDRPLSDRIAHRLETLSSMVDAAIGTKLTPDHVARLLVSGKGALHRVSGTRVVPVINMVDQPERLKLARDVAAKVFAMTDRYDRIVLAAMSAESPLVEIITR